MIEKLTPHHCTIVISSPRASSVSRYLQKSLYHGRTWSVGVDGVGILSSLLISHKSFAILLFFWSWFVRVFIHLKPMCFELAVATVKMVEQEDSTWIYSLFNLNKCHCLQGCIPMSSEVVHLLHWVKNYKWRQWWQWATRQSKNVMPRNPWWILAIGQPITPGRIQTLPSITDHTHQSPTGMLGHPSPFQHLGLVPILSSNHWPVFPHIVIAMLIVSYPTLQLLILYAPLIFHSHMPICPDAWH